MADQAKKGEKVKVHYTGKLDDGTVFDSSREREPLEFTLGEGNVIPGFDKAIEGMSEGETKEVKIPCEDAYGERNADNVMEVPRAQLPQDMTPEKGMTLQARTEQGGVLRLLITDVGEETVTVDGNHPLAGQTLNFDLELMSVEKA